MALIPLGILSAAGSSVASLTDYELIETAIVSGTTTTQVVFSGLGTYSSTYKHLQIRAATRSDSASGTGRLFLQLNADTGNNYTRHSLSGSSTTVVSTSGTQNQSSMTLAETPIAGNTIANVFGAAIFDILDPFSTTKNKTVRSLSGYSSGGNSIIGLYSGAWLNTASVTSVTVTGTGNYVAGSRISLYGIKG